MPIVTVERKSSIPGVATVSVLTAGDLVLSCLEPAKDQPFYLDSNRLPAGVYTLQRAYSSQYDLVIPMLTPEAGIAVSLPDTDVSNQPFASQEAYGRLNAYIDSQSEPIQVVITDE